MKKVLFWILMAGVSLSYGLDDISLNGSWKFRFEDGKKLEDVFSANFETTDVLPVPACFDVMPKWYLKRGTGLYRKTFTLDQAVENAWLVVDGMGLRGAFRIDGKDLGIYPYPYGRLEIATGALSAGEHTIEAALDNRFDWNTMKLAQPFYDFYFYGGFYRGVALRFNPRRLFVRTRDYKTGLVEIEAVNFDKQDFEAELLFDGVEKRQVHFQNSRVKLNVPNFKVWSVENPNLHTVALTSEKLGNVSATRFGIREIKAANRKIYLNGKEVFLKGVNRHDSHYEFGVATSESQMIRDIQIIKGMGANFIRGAHYQQSQRFLDLCDEAGLLVWEESLGWGNGQGYTDGRKNSSLLDPDFCKQQIVQTREMVRTSFNHPCVIIFAFLNECYGVKKECKVLVDNLIETIRKEDSGRLVTFACNSWSGDLCNEKTDLIAFNTYPGTIPSYPGLPEDLNTKVTNNFTTITKYFRNKYPDKPIMVSESGVGATYGLHDVAAPVGSEEFQVEYLTDIFETLWSNPDIVGFAIWQYADNRTYSRNSRFESGKFHGISIAGVVNAQRLPKSSVPIIKRYFKMKP